MSKTKGYIVRLGTGSLQKFFLCKVKVGGICNSSWHSAHMHEIPSFTASQLYSFYFSVGLDTSDSILALITFPMGTLLLLLDRKGSGELCLPSDDGERRPCTAALGKGTVP